MMKIDEYNYYLPPALIANSPKKPRSHCRLLVNKNHSDEIVHDHFYHLNQYLNPRDLLIFNDSKVFPARLIGKKKTGGKVEILLLEENGIFWQVLIGGKVSAGDEISFSESLLCYIVELFGKEAKVKFNSSGANFWCQVNKLGKTPIPPYIKNTPLSEKSLRREYQTVYAKLPGSAAAPTAGLHFSKKLIGELEHQGVEIATINLAVGLGTFAPVSEENIRRKKLHREKFQIPYSTVKKINKTKKAGSKIIAVGTTTVRALESASQKILSCKKEISGSTDLFIQPGFEFKIIDGLITNFHLPRSSLMILVTAFLQFRGEKDGRKKLLELYKIASEKKYRFYSFGDAMMIL